MSRQRSPKNVNLRKLRKGITAQTSSPASSEKSQKSSCQQLASTFLPLSSLLSSNCFYNRIPVTFTAVAAVTVLSILLCQNYEVFVTRNLRTPKSPSVNQTEQTSSGWKLPEINVLQKYGSNICTVERVSVDDFPPEKFEAEFRFKKPVIVTFPNGAEDWTEPKKWSRTEFSKTYSEWMISFGHSLEIVRNGGNARSASTFQNFINNLMDDQRNDTLEPMYYAFDRKFYSQSGLQETLNLPKYFQVNVSEDESIFMLGSALTGVAFHKHSDTWNGVVYGRKRWFLYPNTKTPPGGVHHGFSLLEWVNNVYPNLTADDKPVECVQQAGEILYLPEGTYHATLNLGDTVAIAIQKKNPATKAEELSYEATKLENHIQNQQNKDHKKHYKSDLLKVYEKWLALLPESSEIVMKTGHLLYDMGNYSESLPWHMRAIKMDPYFVVAYLHLAKTFSMLRDYEKAEATFKKAIEISPNLWDTYKEYGEFLLKQGRHRDALPIFKRGTELMPDMIPFWFYYKLCQAEAGDHEGAQTSDQIIQNLKARKELTAD